MNRRSVLALMGSGGTIHVAGCLSGERENCPEPDLKNERSYEVRFPERMHHNGSGIELLTAPDEVDHFVSGALTGEAEDWVTETNFDESVVVAIKEASGGDASNSDFEVMGVEQEPEDTIHVYSCIAEIGGGDVGYFYIRLLRVSYEGQTPAKGKYTHWQEEDKSTYETKE